MSQQSANHTTPAGKDKNKEVLDVPWRRQYIQRNGQRTTTPEEPKKEVDVYYIDGIAKILLGAASDKINFARFSSAASDQLKTTSDPGADQEKDQVVLDKIDHQAGLLILRWINGNNTHKKKALIFSVPKQFDFAFYCKIHHADHAFRLRRELRGDRLRECLEEYICGLQQPTFEDFKIAEEELKVDPPLLYLMRSQAISVHLVNKLAEGEYDKIMDYCRAHEDTGSLQEMQAIEAQIQDGLERSQNGQPKRLESGQSKAETLVVAHRSIEDHTRDAAAAISARTVVKRVKVQFGTKKPGNTLELKEQEEIKPLLTEDIKEGRQVSYASALRF